MSGFEPAGKRLAVALGEFRAARRQAALKAALARLQGDSLALLSFYEVAKQLKVTGQVDRGVREIPLDRIVGSVGRYDDFDRSFLPLKDHDAKRWASVRIAAADPAALPPIEVYQIGTAYFVVDGNHRVSIALRLGGVPRELSGNAKRGQEVVAREHPARVEATRLTWLFSILRVQLWEVIYVRFLFA